MWLTLAIWYAASRSAARCMLVVIPVLFLPLPCPLPTAARPKATGHKIDFDDWHECVHQGALDYDTLLQPDPSLRDILCSIDLPKYILTNANRVHTERALARLGLSDCFQVGGTKDWRSRPSYNELGNWGAIQLAARGSARLGASPHGRRIL